jgi:general nucleoside transport system permease protein
MEIFDFLSIAFLLSILRGATPLLLAALGGLLSERSGIVQISLEGMMLMGALAGALGASFLHSPWLGMLAAGFAGSLMAAIYGFFVLQLKADQIVSGTAINILAVGVAPFITKIAFDTTGSTPSLALTERFSYEPIVLAIIVLILMRYFYAKTRAGLILQFAGESPEALGAAGFSIQKVRWWSLFGCGQLAGWAGGSLSLFLASSYSPNMTAGRGFMALAALIFGRWKPLPTAGACLLFAAADALQIRLQGNESLIPVQFVQILPYIFTIIALAGFFGQSRAPKALGSSVQ